MFQSTLSTAESGFQRFSEFQRRQGPRTTASDAAGSTGLGDLSASLLQDLLRFDDPSREVDGLDLLEVLGASIRHARALTVHLSHDQQVVPCTVFPTERQFHVPLEPGRFEALRLNQLRVLHVEPARLAVSDDVGHQRPLGMMLWELALRGHRDDLLPQIVANAAYRIAPGANLDGLQLKGSLAMAASRLRLHAATLRTIAEWPGFDRERAVRMINGLYLQAALMISRTHPAATNENWVSSRR